MSGAAGVDVEDDSDDGLILENEASIYMLRCSGSAT